MAGRGFGMGDESFYLWWFARPLAFDATIQPFVPPLGALFAAVGESIPAMRIAGLALLLAAGVILARALKRLVPERNPIFPVLTSTAMLASYAVWIATPNYNWLANVSAALLLAGLIGWLGPRPAAASSVLVGVAGALAFFAKPPFAVLAAIAAMAALTRGMRSAGAPAALVQGGIAALVCTATLVGLILATVGPAWFVSSLTLGVELLDFGNSPSAMAAKTVRELLRPPLPAALGVVILAAALALRLTGRTRFAAVLPVIAAGLALVLALHAAGSGREPLGTVGGLMFLLACGALVPASERVAGERDLPALGAALLVLPFLLSFGSTNPIYYQTSLYLWPWMLLIGLAASVRFPGHGGRVTAAMGALLLALIGWASWKPYGLAAPLWEQRHPVALPYSSGSVAMDPASGAAAQALRAAGRGLGISEATPVVDLSAGGPGTALFLGGRPPVFPWLVAIYPTSAATTDRVWRRMTAREQATAVLVGPFHPNQTGSVPAAGFLADPARYRLGATIRQEGAERIDIWVPITR